MPLSQLHQAHCEQGDAGVTAPALLVIYCFWKIKFDTQRPRLTLDSDYIQVTKKEKYFDFPAIAALISQHSC